MKSLRTQSRACALLLAVLAAALPALAQEETPMVVRRASELRAAPNDGAILAPLPADTAVTRLAERQGPWVKVKAAAGTGWVHLFDLKSVGAGGEGSGTSGVTGALRGVTGFFSKAPEQKTTTPTATIGIRGLGAEDLAQAQPDTAAVTRMEALRASDSDARQFARQASLNAVSVEPLPAPAAPSGSSGTGGQPGQGVAP
jgi:hypothetical protein